MQIKSTKLHYISLINLIQNFKLLAIIYFNLNLGLIFFIFILITTLVSQNYLIFISLVLIFPLVGLLLQKYLNISLLKNPILTHISCLIIISFLALIFFIFKLILNIEIVKFLSYFQELIANDFLGTEDFAQEAPLRQEGVSFNNNNYENNLNEPNLTQSGGRAPLTKGANQTDEADIDPSRTAPLQGEENNLLDNTLFILNQGDGNNPGGGNNGGPLGNGPQGPQGPQGPPGLPAVDPYDHSRFRDPEYTIAGLNTWGPGEVPYERTINNDPNHPLFVEFKNPAQYNEFLNSPNKNSLTNELYTKVYGRGQHYNSPGDTPMYLYPSTNGFVVKNTSQFFTLEISESGRIVKTVKDVVVNYRSR